MPKYNEYPSVNADGVPDTGLILVENIGSETRKLSVAQAKLLFGTGGTPDPSPPALLSGKIEDANKSLIILTYNKSLDPTSVPVAPGDIDVSSGGIDQNIVTITVSGANVLIDIDTDFTLSDTNIRIGYVPGPSNRQIKDLAGHAAAAFSNYLITNNIGVQGSGATLASDEFIL